GPGAPPPSRRNVRAPGSRGARRGDSGSRSSVASSLRDQVRALEAQDDLALLVLRLGAPGDDAETRTALGRARRDDVASRRQRVAGIDWSLEGHLFDADKRTTVLDHDVIL